MWSIPKSHVQLNLQAWKQLLNSLTQLNVMPVDLLVQSCDITYVCMGFDKLMFSPEFLLKEFIVK